MFIQLTTMLCAIQMLADDCKGHKFIDLPSDSDDPDPKTESGEKVTSALRTEPVQTSKNSINVMSGARRNVPLLTMENPYRDFSSLPYEDYLRSKIGGLINQTLIDIAKKVNSIQKIKAASMHLAPYRAGFILSLVRKSRMMLNDLFNLAVKHRDNWKALQQLKVFEYIVHTNVDTTHLVRTLVETHMQYLNSTKTVRRKVG